MKTELRYLTHDPDVRGNDRYYVRLKINGQARKKRIRQPFKTAAGEITQDFMVAYWAALAELRGEAAATPTPTMLQEDTFDWLFEQYYRSAAFKKMDKATQRDKRSVLSRFAEKAGELPFKKYRREDMERSQQARAATPGAADKLVKVLKAVYNWGAGQKPAIVTHNPAIGVEPINRKKGGFHTWSPEEVDIFRAYWAIGTIPRLAMELMITIGARRSDAAQIGPRNEFMYQGRRWIRFTAYKVRNRYPVEIEARLTDEFIDAIAKTNVGTDAYILSSRAKPYTVESFGNAFARWSEEAGLPHCSAHGLRKAAAVKLAESGGSASQLMAVFGWSNLITAETYVRDVSKRKMHANAFERRAEYEKKENVSVLAAEKPNETNEEKSDG